ncbi:MAG: hypothetical protein RL329_114 [Bacteroidota bacterium]|jgi:hypothetical protein
MDASIFAHSFAQKNQLKTLATLRRTQGTREPSVFGTLNFYRGNL